MLSLTDYSDIGYNFLIGGDGGVYVGRDWGFAGAHTLGFNTRAFALAFIGNFTAKLPTSKALQGIFVKNNLLIRKKNRIFLSNLKFYGYTAFKYLCLYTIVMD